MFDGLLLFRPLSPILSESDMTAQFENLGGIRAQFENLGELVKNTIFVA